jgi:phytoene/squalene synthetase
MADRLNFVNGLLSMAGPNAKSIAGSDRAVDAVTANNLLDKYSNQITARLSANGMSTDSARSILQSAYPNSKMNQAAINEAADNLIGAQQMTQAKTRLLTPLTTIMRK